MEQENRKLIKFSNYSLCVTLPKSVVRELKWQKGDVVKLSVDNKKGEIVIKKGKNTTIDIKKNHEKATVKMPGNARW